MKYSDWERRYPHHVVIQEEYDEYKSQYFYNSRGRSAYILNRLLNYRFFVERQTGRVAAGGLNLPKIKETFAIHHMSYIIVNSHKILFKETFSDCVFPAGSVNPDNSSEFVNALQSGTGNICYTEELTSPFRKLHYVEGQPVTELIGCRVNHHAPGYGMGIIERAYQTITPRSTDIYLEIKFDNGRVTTPISLTKCQRRNLLDIQERKS